MPASTSAASASCGTHFGDTNDVTSILGMPAETSRLMSSIFFDVGTKTGSDCSPSRGLTSTIVTRLGSVSTSDNPFLVKLGDLVGAKTQQAGIDLLVMSAQARSYPVCASGCPAELRNERRKFNGLVIVYFDLFEHSSRLIVWVFEDLRN